MLPDDRQTTSNTQNTQRNFNQPDNRNTTLTSTAGVSPRAEADANALISYNHLTYFLYVVSYFTAGLLWIVPIVMNYLKRGEAQGTWLATHFDWQIKTFWYSIVFFLIGSAIVIFSLGGLGVMDKRADLKTIDNDRYTDMKWTKVSDLLSKYLKNNR